MHTYTWYIYKCSILSGMGDDEVWWGFFVMMENWAAIQKL